MNRVSFSCLKTKSVLGGLIVAALLIVLYVHLHTPSVIAPTMSDVPTSTVEQNATTTKVVTEEEFKNEPEAAFVALDVKPWKWVSATYTDRTVVTPKNEEDFSIRFNASGAFSAETDCNSISGSYEARNGSLSLGSIASTRMFCEDSQEDEFTKLLSRVLTYRFTSGGQLIMTTTEWVEVVFR